MKLCDRGVASVLAILLCCAASVAGQPTGDEQDGDSDWLRFAPGDAGFYVELHDLSDIRRQFRTLGIWRTVRELSEKDALRTTTQPWQRRTVGLLGLDPEAAITLLLGRRAALIAASSARWQDGVVLAELAHASDQAQLLKRWKARPQPSEGPVRRYVLPAGIMLAVRDRMLVFGPAGDPDGLWGRTVLLLSGQRGPTLRARSDFAGLRSRLSREYPCLIYTVWEEGDPTALEGCNRLLIGVSVETSGMRCELRGHRQTAAARLPCMDASVIEGLPADSVAAWTGGFDFSTLASHLAGGQGADRDPLITLFLGAFSKAGGGSESLLTKLGPAYALVVGLDQSASSVGMTVPAVTALVEAQDGLVYVERLDLIMEFLARVFGALAAPRGGRTEEVAVVRTRIEDVELHRIEIGPLLARRTGLSFLNGVRPCWALLDGRLMVSTSNRHVEKIVRAARGRAPQLNGSEEMMDLLPRESDGEIVAEWLFLRGNVFSSMLSSWLGYAKREHPEALSRRWWQSWAAERLERRGQFGVALVNETANERGAVVREVRPNSPAATFLLKGDVIVGVGGKPLTTTQPAREVADLYRARGGARVLKLQVLRKGKSIVLSIPVSPRPRIDVGSFDPVLALRQLITLSRRARAVTVWRYDTGPGRYDARILVRWGQRERRQTHSLP
ncbi:MAG: PDZ domain-containing protein [Phycisphaerae bacterium]|nr:PDZ domain-containing protein [Phycisphaerae bacterium]